MRESNHPQSKRLRIADAAAELGLSVSTVSRALSGSGRVSDATRKRVVEWMRRNAWLPTSVSRTLQYGKSGTIALTLPKHPNDEFTPFFHYYVLGACETAAAFGYDVIVLHTSESDPVRLKGLIDSNKIDGVLLTDRMGDSLFDVLQGAGIPHVVFGHKQREGLTQIDNDTVGACGEMTGILLDNNLRKIAYLGGSSAHVVNRYREQGFINGFKEKGLQYDARLFYTGIESNLQIEQAVLALMQDGVQGIITGDDVICSRLMAVLHWLGVKVPDEIQVASFYHSFLLDIQSPPVSCVKSDPKTLSGEAAKLLFDLLQGREVPHRNTATHEIVIRGSTRRQLHSA